MTFWDGVVDIVIEWIEVDDTGDGDIVILINKNFTDFHNQGNTLFFLDVSDYSFFRNDNDKNEQ